MHFVYELIDPRTSEVRYVGITTCPKARIAQHLSKTDNTNEHKTAWIQELKEQELQAQIRIIETVGSKQEARKQERYWIRYYLDKNIQLTNIVHVPLLKRNVSQSNKRERELFNRLNREWERLTKVNQPLTTRRLSRLFDYYTFSLNTRFPSKGELVSLWKRKKQDEIQVMLTDPNKYGLLLSLAEDTEITVLL
jgi:hypothetical protein